MPIDLASVVAPEGKLLAWATHSSGLIAVTTRSLVSIDSEAISVALWSDSLQAKWDPPSLTVTFQGHTDSQPTVRSWILDETSQLPRAVRDRVTSAVVVDRVFELPNAGKVRFIARKDEKRTFWSAIADDQAASQSDIGQDEIAKAKAELRASFGI
jgi:hypothetical protein